MAEKVSRERGYRSDTIAISRDMGPLSPLSSNSTPATFSAFAVPIHGAEEVVVLERSQGTLS